MTRAKPDRRVKRTQHSLHVALNTLILEKGYEATTIHDITERANVGRSTLYAHHGGKEGLLLHGFEHLRAALVAAQRQSVGGVGNGETSLLGFSSSFFGHVHQYRDIYRALERSQTGPAVLAAMKRIVSDLVRRELRASSVANAIPRDALARFTVDSFFSVLGWWFEENPTLTPAEVDAIFRGLVLPAFGTAPNGT